MTDIVNPPADTDVTVRSMVAEVINAAWTEGLAQKSNYEAKIASATSGFLDTTAAPHVTAGSVSAPSVSEPAVDIPTTQDGSDWKTYFDSKYLELAGWLADKFSAFRTAYFPDENAAYTAAEDALQAMLANPASYLPASVQAQFFGDDQARILADKVRAQEAVVAQFAGRRFPLPPDAAASAVLQIEQKAQDELAESSRKITMLSVEQLRFAVDSTLKLRQAAMGAAVDYIKALASGPDMASKLVTVGYDAQSKLISAASDFYRSRIQAAELTSKVQQYNNSTQFEAASKNQTADLTLVEDKLKALLAEAQALAQMTTSLFNNVHAQVSISASRGASVGYQYSNDTAGVAPTIMDVG